MGRRSAEWKRSRSSERYSPLGADSLRRDVAVFERNMLLEASEDELVDPGDMIEDLGRFADPIPTVRGDMVVDQ